MNKRIKKKNDNDRIFDEHLKVAIRLVTEVANTYAHLKGYKEANNAFWRNCGEEYDKWIKLPRAKRCWAYIRGNHNIPKSVGYKNKTFRT